MVKLRARAFCIETPAFSSRVQHRVEQVLGTSRVCFGVVVDLRRCERGVPYCSPDRRLVETRMRRVLVQGVDCEQDAAVQRVLLYVRGRLVRCIGRAFLRCFMQGRTNATHLD